MRTLAPRTDVVLAAIAALGLCLASPAVQAAKGKKKPPAAEQPVAKPAADTDNEAEGAAAEQDQPKVKVERGAGGKKVYKIEGEIVIEGKIQKPEAFYVLQKSNINYDWHELKQEFVPRILESVTKAPF